MNKAQMAALFLAGAATGAGGVKLAQPGAPEVRVHALDLRRGADLPDGGFEVSRVAYGTVLRPDGSKKDIGQAKSCMPGDQSALRAALSAAATDCSWER